MSIINLALGSKDPLVKEIQEWLCYYGYRVIIDGDLGPITLSAYREWNHSLDSVIDDAAMQRLRFPITAATSSLDRYGKPLSDTVIEVAQQHLVERPREYGGENSGMWVRLYMNGFQGVAYPWCAGFATTVLNQAIADCRLGHSLSYTWSCDVLANQAKSLDRFTTDVSVVKPGYLFLVRDPKHVGQYLHVGIVLRVFDSYFMSIEGNSNEDGSPNGYEVCSIRRSFVGKDFVII